MMCDVFQHSLTCLKMWGREGEESIDRKTTYPSNFLNPEFVCGVIRIAPIKFFWASNTVKKYLA